MKDVTGFVLGEALLLLKAEGIAEIQVKLATAPRKAGEEYSHKSRVVRQKALGDAVVELIVCNIESENGLMSRD